MIDKILHFITIKLIFLEKKSIKYRLYGEKVLILHTKNNTTKPITTKLLK